MWPITELGHGRQGQNKMGGVKWVSNPHVGKKDKVVCLSGMECSYPHKEVPLLPAEGWLPTSTEPNQNH